MSCSSSPAAESLRTIRADWPGPWGGPGRWPFELALPSLALADHRVEEIAILRGNRLPLSQDFTEGLPPVEEPDPHRLEQIILAHKVHLHRQDAEQQVRVASCPAP